MNLSDRTPKRLLPACLIDALRVGPSSLNARDPFDPHNKAKDVIRAQLHSDYLLWLETWIVPQIKRLEPKAKP